MNPFKTAFILPVILIAATAFVVIQVKSKAPIEHEEAKFPTRTVEVINVSKIPFRGRATAFGNVEPAVLLKAKAEVSGKISYRHPKLKKGASLKKGTVLIGIEPTSYKISLNKSKAGLASSQSSLKQLQAEEASTRRSLNIAQKNLNVGLKELGRIRQIWNKRLIAHSTLDAEEQKVLQLRQQVEEVKGKLASFASRKAATKAQISQSKSQVNQSQDTLGRTTVRLPFDARIGSVFVEKGEFINAGSVLFEASGTQAVEITAQLPTRQFRPLLSSGLGTKTINFTNAASFNKIISQMKLQAKVSLVTGSDRSPHWEGELVRISESIDPTRDTIGLVVAVNNPYGGVVPGKHPPLLKGMYTAVEFLAPAQKALVIPRKAIHQGRVYLVGKDNTLTIREVELNYTQGNLAILKSGIKPGEQLIISDVIPVIEGLPLAPVLNQAYEKQLKNDAAKRGASK